MARWSAQMAGVLELPSGRTIRGRSSRQIVGIDSADWSLRLAALRPNRVREPLTWIAWPDFGLPINRRVAGCALRDAWARSARDRVDITCWGGRGRTGTALACIAVIDGMESAAAIALVRQQYNRRAIEAPWQERYVTTFGSTTRPSVTP